MCQRRATSSIECGELGGPGRIAGLWFLVCKVVRLGISCSSGGAGVLTTTHPIEHVEVTEEADAVPTTFARRVTSGKSLVMIIAFK
jgi:hypothetical protein